MAHRVNASLLTPRGLHGPHTDFAGAMSYGDYLQLDTLLNAQQPRSDSHDEMLFIIIHQSSELWMKLALHELAAARGLLLAEDLQLAFKHLARVSRIQSQLIQSWDVLSTMTPSDYSGFRDALGKSSGFQSAQYRLIEFALGNKQASMLAPHRHRSDAARAARSGRSRRRASTTRRSVCSHDAASPSMRACLTRDVREPYHSNPSVLAAWTQVYRDPRQYWDLYQLAEELIDLEDWFQQWRFRHVTTVQRIIGRKRGTGGTAGVDYLQAGTRRHLLPGALGRSNGAVETSMAQTITRADLEIARPRRSAAGLSRSLHDSRGNHLSRWQLARRDAGRDAGSSARGDRRSVGTRSHQELEHPRVDRHPETHRREDRTPDRRARGRDHRRRLDDDQSLQVPRRRAGASAGPARHRVRAQQLSDGPVYRRWVDSPSGPRAHAAARGARRTRRRDHGRRRRR